MVDPNPKIVIRARDETGRAFKAANQNMKKMAATAKKLALPIAAITATVGAMVRSTVIATREIGAYSDALGVSIENMTRWQYAAESVGLRGDKIGDIMKDTAEKIGDAWRNNAGEAKEAVEGLGLNLAALVEKAPDRQLLEIAEALENVGTRAEKIQILESLGNDLSIMLPLLEDNAAGLKSMARESDLLGATLTETEREGIRKAGETLRKLKASFDSIGQTLTAQLGGPLLDTANWFKDNLPAAIAKAQKWINNIAASWATLKRVFSADLFEKVVVADIFEQEYAKIQALQDAALARGGMDISIIGTPEQIAAEAELERLALWTEYQKNQEMAWRHQQALATIFGTGAEQRLRFELASRKKQTAIVVGELTKMTRGVAQHNRTMFEINKIAGIAEATIHAWQGASRTMAAYPYPLNVALAGLSLAAGLAQVQAIKNTSFTGGGSGGSIGSGASALPPSDVGTLGVIDTEPRGPSININVEGNVFANDDWRQAMIDQIKTALDNDELEPGFI